MSLNKFNPNKGNMKVLGMYAIMAVAIMSLTFAMPAIAEAPPYLDIVSGESSSKQNNSEFVVNLAADFEDGIDAGDLYGVGIMTQRGLVAVTSHGGVFDSEAQDSVADPVPHTHAIITKDSEDCSSGVAVQEVTFEQVGELQINGDEVRLEEITSDFASRVTGPVISFQISGEGSDVCINQTDELEE